MSAFARRLAAVTVALCAVSVTGLSINSASAWGRFPGGHHPAYHAHWAQPGCVGCGVGAGVVAGIVGGVALGAVIAGSRPSTVIVAPPPPPIGAQVAVLPPGCAAMNVNGAQYYQCGPAWYQPYFGGGGVYYAVVPAP